jgi:hypothetical protein
VYNIENIRLLYARNYLCVPVVSYKEGETLEGVANFHITLSLSSLSRERGNDIPRVCKYIRRLHSSRDNNLLVFHLCYPVAPCTRHLAHRPCHHPRHVAIVILFVIIVDCIVCWHEMDMDRHCTKRPSSIFA